MSTDIAKPKKGLRCFSYLLLFVLIMVGIIIYSTITHPPIDYFKVFSVLAISATLLLIYSPWLKNVRLGHPTIVILPLFLAMLLTLYPLVTRGSVDYLMVFLTIATYTLIALSISPLYRQMLQRSSLIVPIVIGLSIIVEVLPSLLRPRVDYFGLFWLAVGVVAYILVLLFIARKRPQVATATTTGEEPVVPHQIAEPLDEKPTSEFTFLGIRVKVFGRGRFRRMRIEF